MKNSVSNIMTKAVYTINTEDGVGKAGRIMDEKDIDSLPVYDNGRLVGIITSKDIRKTHPNRIVADAMTSEIVSIAPEASIWEAHKVLEQNNIGRLLVLDDGNLVGIITRATLSAELGKHIDQLTGLYKSEYINHQIFELLVRGMEVSLILIDLDRFGFIDKVHGHVIGDIILKEVSDILVENAPEEAQICRYGGDEFVIITPFDIDKCKELAENLLDIISAHVFYSGISISASAGITKGALAKSTQNTPLNFVKTLINTASLASTRAKNENSRIIVDENTFVTEIA